MAASTKGFSVFLIILFAGVLTIPLESTADKIPVKNMKHVIGIVEIPPLFGVLDPHGPPGSRLPFTPASVSVFEQPTSGSRVIKVINNPKDIATAEYGYEQSGALVYDIKDNWYLIGIGGSTSSVSGWLRHTVTGNYHSLESLLKRSVAYLTPSWDSKLTQVPTGDTSGYTGKARDIKVIEKRMVNKEVWFHVELLHPGPCSGATTKVVAKGWIPAMTADGHMNVWFYSRGC